MSTSLLPQRATSRKALAGFLLALLSLGLGFWAGYSALLVGIIGLTLAVLGWREILRSQGGLQGKGFAVLGIGGVFLSGLVVLVVKPAMQRVRMTANRMNAT